MSIVDPEQKKRIAGAMGMFVRTFLVSGRAGQPAEGRLPFNPLNFHILEALLNDGPLRLSDLVEEMRVPKTTLASAIGALEKRELLEKKPHPTDGRAKILSLTSEGQATAEAIQRQNLMNAGVLLALLPDNRVAGFTDDMELLGEKLRELMASS